MMFSESSKPGYFITGTDTSVGKTVTACALLAAYQALGCRAAGFKPISSGCITTQQGLRHDDALALQHYSHGKPPYSLINPFAFEPAIAPHIAAAEKNITLTIPKIMETYEQLQNEPVDILIVEGIGGWLTPLNQKETLADLAKAMQLPVILVVALRLGCLNHALLTANAIQDSGLVLAGWIANCLPPYPEALEANILTLSEAINAPRLSIFQTKAPWKIR